MVTKSRNTSIKGGVNKLSRSAMFSKRYTFIYKHNKTAVEKKNASAMEEKVIGGEKNGGKRLVRKAKMVSFS